MKNKQPCCEKFKTTIGGQALIEGIMMRGPEKDAIVVRKSDGPLDVDIRPRKIPPKKSVLNWPLIRGVRTFFNSQVVGVKALMHSADLSPEESLKRISKGRTTTELYEKLDTLESVRKRFFDVFDILKDRDNIKVIDTTGCSIEEVAVKISDAVTDSGII